MNYAGFWQRTAAGLIDAFIFAVIVLPVLYMVHGAEYFTYVPEDGNLFQPFGFADVFLNYIFPFLFTLFFWLKCAATPGKMALGLKVVDVDTGENINMRQSIIRYIGYFLAMIPLCLGIFWIGLDKRKQGWHDKMAGTTVVRQ